MKNLSITSKDTKKELQLSENKSLAISKQLGQGIRIRNISPDDCYTFVSQSVFLSYQKAGIKNKNKSEEESEEDLMLIIGFLSEEIKENFQNLTEAEVKKAFANGIFGRYKGYGNHNLGLPTSAFVFFLDCFVKEKAKLNQSMIGRIENQKRTHEEISISNQVREKAQNEHDTFYTEKFIKLLYKVGNSAEEGKQIDLFHFTDMDITNLNVIAERYCKTHDTPITEQQFQRINEIVKEKKLVGFGGFLATNRTSVVKQRNTNLRDFKDKLLSRLNFEMRVYNIVKLTDSNSKYGSKFLKFSNLTSVSSE